VETFLSDGLVYWTPTVSGETLRRFIAAAALAPIEGDK
jgi:hypothetical protein